MSGWAGFSEDELRRIQQRGPAGPSAEPPAGPPAGPWTSTRGRKPSSSTRSRQQVQREKALQLAGSPGLPPEQQLYKPPLKETMEMKTTKNLQEEEGQKKTTKNHQEEGQKETTKNHQEEGQKETTAMETTNNHQEEVLVVKELEKQEVELREKTRLEQLQQEQKLMEEKNKRKKALLAKTIAEKSKQTQAEAVKLKRIQKELQALDDMVSNDIGILRGKIEEASWDYTAARKRYEKAEAEYVVAKLELHKKTEAKEHLTEHLYAIIQQNELRKAHKLEELMQQLQLQEDMTLGDGGEGGGEGGGEEGTVELKDCRATVEDQQDCNTAEECPQEESVS